MPSAGEKGKAVSTKLIALVASTALIASGCSHAEGTKGACATYGVYAQNRYQPYGAAIRETPDVLAKKIGSFAPNEVVAVNGWTVANHPAYPDNPTPWNSAVWFHLANENGWVSFAAVRGDITYPYPKPITPPGGEIAGTPADCQMPFPK